MGRAFLAAHVSVLKIVDRACADSVPLGYNPEGAEQAILREDRAILPAVLCEVEEDLYISL